nr:NACHT, LRR and PYD domains-containing protein 14 [Peromyscus maniculatus bairdii]
MESEDVEMIEDHVSEEEILSGDKDFDDRRDYRTIIKEKFYIIWDKSSLLGESATLNHVITEKDQKLLDRIFEVDIKTYKIPQTVILQGAAGIGKTMLLRKAMLEWANGNLYQQFTYAFYLSGREISQVKEKSFAQLISKNWPRSEGPIERILSKPSNLLFIIDSFDELDFSFEEPEFALCNDWTQKQPVSFLISSLLRKVMLPESFLLVTARPTAWKRLKPLLHKPHGVKLPGLSKNARMDYIHHLLKDKTWAMDGICSIRKNERLFNMCHVSHVCKVICTCLKEQVKKGGNIAVICQTTTALFTCYICSLFSQIDWSITTLPNETLVRSLCQAAAEGIWTMNHILYKKNLRKHELTRDDISVFLHVKVLQKDTEYGNCFAFTHLHIQEFFAALFYFLRENPEEKDYPIKRFENLHLLLESNCFHDPHLEQMKCFLFGLLNKERVRQLEETFGSVCFLNNCQDFSFLTTCHTLTHLDLKNVDLEDNGLESLCQNLISQRCKLRVLRLESCDLNVYRCLKLAEALKSNKSLVFLNLSTNNLSNDGVKSLCQTLENPNCHLERLSLASCGITKAVCEALSLAITKSKRLTHLCLADNILEDEGIELLSDALRYPQCTLQSLVLRCCCVTSVGSKFLSDALLNNRSLIHLDLGSNKLQDSGIKLLCHILQQPTCTIQELELMGCILTSDGCLDLAPVIVNNPNLWSLDLGNNNLEDAGLHILCEALKDPNCHIQRLGLENCGLTPVCCQDLLSLFSGNQSLIQMNLMKNALNYDTIKNLCTVLRSPTCKIKFLALDNKEILGEKIKKFVNDVRTNNPQLVIKPHYYNTESERWWKYF